MRPHRWVWMIEHGPISTTNDVCGHARRRTALRSPPRRRSSQARLRYTDQQMIGRVQVVAMQLGHTPSLLEWEAGTTNPTLNVYKQRSATGPRCAPRRASNERTRTEARPPSACVEALRALARHLGHAPTYANSTPAVPGSRRAGSCHLDDDPTEARPRSDALASAGLSTRQAA